MKSEQMTAGEMIKEARLEKDMTQNELGRLLGFKQGNFIGMFEKGRSPIPFNRIPDICRLLDLNPYLMFKLVLKERAPEMSKCLWG